MAQLTSKPRRAGDGRAAARETRKAGVRALRYLLLAGWRRRFSSLPRSPAARGAWPGRPWHRQRSAGPALRSCGTFGLAGVLAQLTSKPRRARDGGPAARETRKAGVRALRYLLGCAIRTIDASVFSDLRYPVPCRSLTAFRSDSNLLASSIVGCFTLGKMADSNPPVAIQPFRPLDFRRPLCDTRVCLECNWP